MAVWQAGQALGRGTLRASGVFPSRLGLGLQALGGVAWRVRVL